MTDDAYDLRSNIKGKPGSQGTLFQVNDKSLLNTSRYPRGYTPDRQREVDAALPHVFGIQKPPDGSFNTQTNRFDYDYPHARSIVREAVSRSSIPVSDLQGLRSIGPNIRPTEAGVDRIGSYSAMTRQINVNFNQPRHVMDPVIVHEIGHHVDNQSGNSEEFKNPGRPPSDYARGRGEGVADNYMERHHRSHRRHASEPLNDYASRMDQETLNTNYPGYTEHRHTPPPLSASQFHQGELF